MKMFKRLGLVFSALMLSVTLASCTDKEVRNTVVPYGTLNLDSVVAESKDGSIKLTLDDYYTRLRAKSFDVFNEELKKFLYADEITAVAELINSTSYSSSASYATVLSFTDSPISEERYEELKKIITEAISNTFASAILSTTSASTLASKTDEEINTSIAKYIDTQARRGITISNENISWTVDNDLDKISIDISKLPQELVATQILTQAERMYAQKALYSIADLEYLNEGTDEEEKNGNYLFKDTKIESTYESSYMTFGTYKSIIVTYNTRLEALTAVEKVKNSLNITEINDENVEDVYLALYNEQYSYKGNQTIDSTEFDYVVSLEKNDLEEISSSVNTLVTSTLDNGEFLSEPRNIDNKYVLAYRISTEYDYNNGTDLSEQISYSDLDETTKAEIDEKVKNNLVRANVDTYISTALKELIAESEIEIYDPFFEYRFNYTYTDQYTLVEGSNNEVIFTCGDKSLSVEDFYAAASQRYANTIVTAYFQEEYAYQFADEFVTEKTIETNEEALDEAIKTFEKDENSTYPVEIGLETYLLAAYGYANKEDVLKYYYTASSALSAYKSKVLFDEWASEADSEGNRGISDEAKKILNNILAVGNAEYDNLFSLNVDHILINVDYDGDGSLDDPDKFYETLSDEKKEAFTNAVSNLAQAIYKEAIYEDYSDNSLYETLAYIVKQYNKNATLLSDPTKTWADYKSEFHLQLTAEQLASSSDITQDSVNNFVKPFATYLEEMYAQASTDNVIPHDNGNFFIVNEGVVDKAEDAELITDSTLCKTVYGYHLIVLNSFEGPEQLRYTEDDDTNGYQAAIKVLINENDSETDDDNLYVTLNSYNTETDEANINQLFIYYVEKKNGVDSSLDVDIEDLMSTLFDDAIAMYSSSNFQTYILLKDLGITSTDTVIKNAIDAEVKYYSNLVIDYDSASEYIDWLEFDWSRPE